MRRISTIRRLLGPLCVLALLGAAAPSHAESFEVEVLRGAEVVLVRSDENGARTEKVLRKAPPRPPAPAKEETEEPPAQVQPVVVIIENPVFDQVYGFRHGFGWAPVPERVGRHRPHGPRHAHRSRGVVRAQPHARGRARMEM